MANDRTPIRQRLKAFLTPKVADFLVTESKHVAYKDLPEFGTPHPDSTRYPNHKFCYAMPEDEMGQRYSAIYAMARSNQDDYNWEFSEADIGGTKFDAVQRTYVTLRSAYSATTPTQGAAMPNVPTSLFGTGTGSPSTIAAYVLAERKQVRSGDKELDTIFVVEQVLYVKKVTLTDNVIDRESGLVETESTTLFYRGESITVGDTTQAIEVWVADTTNAYWSTDANGYGRECKQLSENWFAVTQRQIINTDTGWKKSADKLRPQKYYCPDSTTTSTVITPNATPGEPDMPTAATGQAVTVEKKGRISATTTVTQGGTPQTLKGLSFNSQDGKLYPETDELVEQSAVPTSASLIDSNGRIIEYQSIDGCDASKVTRQAVSLENEYVKGVARLKPEKFILDAANVTTVVTTTGVTTEPDAPTAEDQTRKSVRQKGAIRIAETMLQSGTLVPLKGTDLDEDGYHYPVTQEVVDMASVPLARVILGTDGRVSTFSPYDANYAIKETRQAVSLEPGTRKRTSKMAPDRFYREKQVVSTEEIATGVTSAIVMPVVALGSDVDITQKGSIRRIRTINPPGPTAPNKGTSLDERTGEAFVETIEVVPIELVMQTSVDSAGNLITYDPIDANWSLKRTRKVASTLAKTWTEITNYEWPPVLLGLQFKVWNAKNGRGAVTYVVPRWKQGFNGPQQMQVSQYWQQTQPAVVVPVNMIAEGFEYQSPLFNVRIPPCLHDTYVLTCTVDSSDPEWEPATDSETFLATNYSDWPAQVFWREAKPYLGGFLVTEYTINRPT